MANDKIIKGVTTAYLLTLKPNAEFFHRAWPMSDSFRSCVYKSMDLIKLSRRPLIIVAFLLFFAVTGTTCSAADCDEFVSWVAPAKNAYQKTHRIYPVPAIYKDLAVRYMPRIWVPPESWQPIDFDDYLAKSRLVGKYDRKVLIAAPSVRDMIALDYEEQCAVYLETDEVAPRNPAPIYIQAFHDENPADETHQMTCTRRIGMPWSILCASAWRRQYQTNKMGLGTRKLENSLQLAAGKFIHEFCEFQKPPDSMHRGRRGLTRPCSLLTRESRPRNAWQKL